MVNTVSAEKPNSKSIGETAFTSWDVVSLACNWHISKMIYKNTLFTVARNAHEAEQRITPFDISIK